MYINLFQAWQKELSFLNYIYLWEVYSTTVATKWLKQACIGTFLRPLQIISPLYCTQRPVMIDIRHLQIWFGGAFSIFTRVQSFRKT